MTALEDFLDNTYGNPNPEATDVEVAAAVTAHEADAGAHSAAYVPLTGAVGSPFTPRSGNYYSTPFTVASASAGLSADYLRMTPITFVRPVTLDRIGVNIMVVGTAGAVFRMGIYASDGTGAVPGSLILDAGTVIADVGTGFKEITISQALDAGNYWIGGVTQVALSSPLCFGATSAKLRGAPTATEAHSLSAGFGYHTDTARVPGALPAAFGAVTAGAPNIFPHILVRVA